MKKYILLMFFVLPTFVFGQDLSINNENVNDVEIDLLNGVIYDIETTGKDPYVFTDPLALHMVPMQNPKRAYAIHIRKK